MPFQEPNLHSARCFFTGTDCHKNCAAATYYPDHPDWWKCKLVLAIEHLLMKAAASPWLGFPPISGPGWSPPVSSADEVGDLMPIAANKKKR